MSITEIIALATAIGGLVAAYVAWRRWPFDADKTKAEARKLNGETKDGSAKVGAETRKIGEEADQLQFDTLKGLVIMLQSDIANMRVRVEISDKARNEIEREMAGLSARLILAEAAVVRTAKENVEYLEKVTQIRGEFIAAGEQFTYIKNRDKAAFNALACIVIKLAAQLEDLGKSPELSKKECDVLDELIKEQ